MDAETIRLFESNYIPEPNSGCWIWLRCCHQVRGKDWHGVMKRNRWPTTQLAHRVSWEIHNGPIPDDTCVLHHCDVPLCVNPDHLFLGSQADNVRDMINKNRDVRLHGTANPKAKLTDDAVADIRTKRMSSRKFAALYGVGKSAVSAIWRGENWRRG